MEYGDGICESIRNHSFTENFDDLATIALLDNAILKSRIKREYRIYRGVGGDFGIELLRNISQGLGCFVEPAFTSFTANIDIALGYADIYGQERVVFIADCPIGENALFIGGDEKEIIYPRLKGWRIIQTRKTEIDGLKITFIYIKSVTSSSR